ncbi:multifunctional procollagen lysine hydroxylase and glycosyltransferase LH3 [Cherax quadricarinatus]
MRRRGIPVVPGLAAMCILWTLTTAGVQESGSFGAGVHVVGLLGDASTREDHFLQSLCRLQYPSVQVLKNWCPSGRCEEDARLEDQLKNLPEDDLVIVVSLWDEFVYFVASYADARAHLMDVENSLIVAHVSFLSPDDGKKQKRKEKYVDKKMAEDREEDKMNNEEREGEHDSIRDNVNIPRESGENLEKETKFKNNEAKVLARKKQEDYEDENTGLEKDAIQISDKNDNDEKNKRKIREVEEEANFSSENKDDEAAKKGKTKGSNKEEVRTDENLVWSVLKGGVVMGRVSSLMRTLQERRVGGTQLVDDIQREGGTQSEGGIQREGGTMQTVPDTVAEYVVFGERQEGTLTMTEPLRVAFTAAGSADGEARRPLLAYSLHQNLDFYNTFEVLGEERGACPYYPYSAHATPTQLEQDPRLLVVLLLGGSWAPFLDEVLRGLASQTYPKDKMGIWILAKTGQQETEISQFMARHQHQYASLEVTRDQELQPHLARSKCEAVGCSFLLLMEPQGLLEDPATISTLVASDRSVVAPLLKQRRKDGKVNYMYGGASSSVWNQFIRDRTFRATLQVEDVHTIRLVRRDLIDDYLAGKQVACYINTSGRSGQLLDPRGYKEGKKHPDLWGIRHNTEAWSRRYLHPDLFKIIKGKKEPEEVGAYLYYVPFFTERFCKEMIEEMEHFGQWFNKDYDDRDEGHVYSSVNINLSQIGYSREYNMIINSVKMELLKTLYGYSSRGAAMLLFVLKYSASSHYNTFTYHLDGGTYTFNIALNSGFMGGGLEYKLGNTYFGTEREFVVSHNRTGWAVVQPDRPLHMHHGVPLTFGVRYALIAIIDTDDQGCKGGPTYI